MSDWAARIHINNPERVALLVSSLNSIVLDFAARSAVGGTDLSYFIIKQLPIPPPEVFLEDAVEGFTYAELIVPRVLELTYTSYEVESLATDLGGGGPPFSWDEERRHRLRCELDAILAHLYRLDRSELEWILEAPPPSASFPALKRNELKEFDEYRTQRYILKAYDQLQRGRIPDLEEAF